MVCDDGWDFFEIGVVCRQLCLGSGIVGVFLIYILKGIGKFWFDDVFCVGIEDLFLKCWYCFWG